MNGGLPHARSRSWLLLLTGAMLVLILYVGLRFREDALTNDVTWIQESAGIRFGPSGIVYADAVDLATPPQAPATPPFSIELALKSAVAGDGHFQFVALLHGGADDRQLVIGQWRSWLIVMNGDDYDARRRFPRIAVNAFQPVATRFVSIVSGNEGTTVYLDGLVAKRNPNLVLQKPAPGQAGRLVLGNSVYGRHAWSGELYGLAYFERTLDAEAVGRHFAQWRRDGTFAFAADDDPAGLYLFNEQQGTTIRDRSGRGNDLRIPARMTILIKEFLSTPFADGSNRPSLFQDMLINLTGFIPMGLLLSLLMSRGKSQRLGKRLGWVMLSCAGLSLAIELSQAWIPTRSSQMLDLFLNTLGAGLGVLLHSAARRALPDGRKGAGR